MKKKWRLEGRTRTAQLEVGCPPALDGGVGLDGSAGSTRAAWGLVCGRGEGGKAGSLSGYWERCRAPGRLSWLSWWSAPSLSSCLRWTGVKVSEPAVGGDWRLQHERSGTMPGTGCPTLHLPPRSTQHPGSSGLSVLPLRP